MISAADALAARRHAEVCAPEESCGLVIDGRYRPVRNLAQDPRAGFRVNPKTMRQALRAGLGGVIHSHPHPYAPCPSLADQRQQVAQGVPWAIVPVSEDGVAGELVWWGPGVARLALVGRPYRWGVTDCYSCVRDYYAGQGIELADYPRAWRCWAADHSERIRQHFRESGFVEVRPAEAAVGDTLTMHTGSSKISHLAVIVEPDVMLHHPCSGEPYDPGRLSRREPVARYRPYILGVMRHRGPVR